MSQKRRYAIVGTGGRATMFFDPIHKDFRESSELVALCDSSLTRAEYYNNRRKSEFSLPEVPLFHSDDFDRMIAEAKPDRVIVCSMDATHHTYILKTLEAGLDVITEKPMTIDDEKCRAIVYAANRRPKQSVRVCFNYRWIPGCTEVKKLIESGAIGQIKHVQMEYLLDTSHGADYFRRWHSYKECSGGLLVHKSTHHFDLVNWWIDAIPEEVYAQGNLSYYGRHNALARGDERWTKYPRYTGYDTEGDPFALKLDVDKGGPGGKNMQLLYQNAEADSGYIRDENVFRDNISIEDTMSVMVRYRNGVLFNYSLVAYSPVEGKRVTFNGDKGRIEYEAWGGSHIIAGQSDEELAQQQNSDKGWHRILVRPLFKPSYEVPVPHRAGGHGGGDALLIEQIFSPNPPDEPLGRNAGYEQGAASILIGIAGNHSIASKRSVQLGELCLLRPTCTKLGELTR